jgi:hypothetical protein
MLTVGSTKIEPEADGSSINPNDPFFAEVTNEIRSPLRASRTTIFPRGGTHVVSTVPILFVRLRRFRAISHENRTSPVDCLNANEASHNVSAPVTYWSSFRNTTGTVTFDAGTKTGQADITIDMTTVTSPRASKVY